MKNITLNQCSVVEREGQPVFTLNNEIHIPEDAPVRLTNAQLEEPDYRKLYEAYSSKGRKSVTDPRVLFKIPVYGYQCGIYTTRKPEEACRLRLCRSIQVEGAFGLLKNDFGFRRFLTRGRRNVRTELFFLALAFDLKKLRMKRDKGRLQTHLSEISTA